MEKSNFIKEKIKRDIKSNKYDSRVHTRFPPEPNGFLHIGHAKAICLNFDIAREFGGLCNLRFDDTNPTQEKQIYVQSIQEDIKWLGFDWEKRLFFASDYFEKFYQFAIKLVKMGKAYVDSQSEEDIKKNRGTVKTAGIESPYRNRSISESLNLLERMKNGEFDEGEHVLRAKIDMSSSNMLMRDPLIYRIKKVPHHRQKKSWNIYPMYDFAHCLEDSIEMITHSLCSIEFENNRPLYDWFLNTLKLYHPTQIEFARLNINYTVMSKRILAELVEKGYVSGWDDPRLPTISALRRRGYTPIAIRNFCSLIGLAKRESEVDISLLEFSIRKDLNKKAQRKLVVLDPLKIEIENYPENTEEELLAVNNPENTCQGKREVPFSKVLYIEREDFMENPPKKFFRLSPGSEVRLRYAYFIKCKKVIKDESGKIVKLICTYDPATKGGNSPDDRKVRATLHWVSAKHSIQREVRLYDRLFTTKHLTKDNFLEYLNPNSEKVLKNCRLEPSLKDAKVGEFFQFERKGYFCIDSKNNKVFNRTVTLRDTWARVQQRESKREK